MEARRSRALRSEIEAPKYRDMKTIIADTAAKHHREVAAIRIASTKETNEQKKPSKAGQRSANTSRSALTEKKGKKGGRKNRYYQN